MTTTIVNRTRGNVLCEQAELATTPWLRMRGLIGRSSLPAGSGILFPRDSSIHSAFMRFDFDAIFMDSELRVVKLSERIPPWRARAAMRARKVLELAAGEICRLGVQVDDQLAVDGSGTNHHPEQTTAR